MTRRLVFDIEANGFLSDVSQIHCLVLVDADTGELFDYADQPGYTPNRAGLDVLSEADEIIGHNIIKYDSRFWRSCTAGAPKPTRRSPTRSSGRD
jgi:hypothetical protein